MFSPKDKGSEYLKDKIFVGFVEDNLDDKRKGRIKVRVQGVFNDIEVDHIPWASPFRSLDGRSFCVPANGKIVNVIFPEGNLYEPQYIYSENYNINLQNKLKDYSDDEYKNFVALLFDDRTQIYSDDKNLRLDYYHNQINLSEKRIDLHLKDNTQELHLGQDTADQSAVLGDHWMIWFDKFMQILLIPSSLTGNAAAPILRPALDQVILEYKALRQTFLSQHVKIVDNGSCINTNVDRQCSPTLDDFTEINGEKILSTNAEPSLKEKIIEDREKQSQKAEENKPEQEDVRDPRLGSANGGRGEDGLLYGDSPNPESLSKTTNIVVDDTYANFWDSSLQQEQKELIQKNIEISRRKSVPTKKEVTPVDPNIDPYSGFWNGRQGRTKESFKQNTQDGYGTYISDNNNGTYVPSGCDDCNGTFDAGILKTVYDFLILPTGQEARRTPIGLIKNGEIPLDKLTKISGFILPNGQKTSAYFELNAAAAFNELNKEFIKKFGKPIEFDGPGSNYRTYEQQNTLWKMYKDGTGNLAATPGTSNHGWGLALDINGITNTGKFNSPLYKWLWENGKKWQIHNPSWAREGKSTREWWHWEYYGDNIYCGKVNDTSSKPNDILLLGGLDTCTGDLNISQQTNLVKQGVENLLGVKGFRYTNTTDFLNNINKDSVIIVFSSGTGSADRAAKKLKELGGNLNNMFIVEGGSYSAVSIRNAVSLGVPSKNVWYGVGYKLVDGVGAAGEGIIAGSTATNSCSILSSELLKGAGQKTHFCALYEVGKYIKDNVL